MWVINEYCNKIHCLVLYFLIYIDNLNVIIDVYVNIESKIF